jgi:hypothetical protein
MTRALKCINEKELKSKGFASEFSFSDIEIDRALVNSLDRYTVLIVDITEGEQYLQKVHVQREHDKEVWFITENSFTDNLDNETFTYFKYCLKNEAF